MELDLVSPGGDRLDHSLQRLLTELELEQYIDEEAASVPTVLQEVHVEAESAVLLATAPVAEDQLVDSALRIGVALTGDRGLGIDREPERRAPAAPP